MNKYETKLRLLFPDKRILSILDYNESYIVTVMSNGADTSTAIDETYKVNKKDNTVQEFSYMLHPDEYREACNHVLYRITDSSKFSQNESNSDIEHSGVKGQVHGERRYQNPDGTWTELGKERRRMQSKSDKVKRALDKIKSISKKVGDKTSDISSKTNAVLKKVQENRNRKLEQENIKKEEAKKAELLAQEESKAKKLADEKAKYSKNASAAYAHRDLYTSKELEQIINRSNIEQRAFEASLNERNRALNSANNIINYGTAAQNAYKLLSSQEGKILMNAIGLPTLPSSYAELLAGQSNNKNNKNNKSNKK